MFVEDAWNAQQSPIKEWLSPWEAYNSRLKLNCFELGEQLNKVAEHLIFLGVVDALSFYNFSLILNIYC